MVVGFSTFDKAMNVVGERLQGISFVLQPTHVSIPPNQNGTIPKAGFVRRGNVIGKVQPFERCYKMAFVLRRDERAGGTWCSD